MYLCLALRRLLPLLAVLSLAFAPVTASVAVAGMHTSMAMQIHAAAMPEEAIVDMAGTAMGDMPCCPKEQPAMPDCPKSCPLMALCLAKVATDLPAGLRMLARLAVVEGTVWAVTASFESLSQGPPTEPPRA